MRTMILCVCAAIFMGCSGQDTQLRFIHAVADQGPIEIRVQGKVFESDLAFATATAFKSIYATKRVIELFDASTGTPLIAFQEDFEADTPVTLALVQGSSAIEAIREVEALAEPAEGKANLKLWHLAKQKLPPSDVYLSDQANDATFDGISAGFTDLGFNSVVAFEALTAGAYRLGLTAVGETTILADSEAFTLASQDQALFIAVDQPDGAREVSLIRVD